MNNENSLESEFLVYASILELFENQEEMSFLELKALKDGIASLKEVKELSDKVANLKLERTIHSMDRALFEIEKELLAKDKEIDELKKQLESINKPKASEKLVHKNNQWYVNDVDTPQMPVCRNCTIKLNEIIFATQVILAGHSFPYQCPECKNPV